MRTCSWLKKIQVDTFYSLCGGIFREKLFPSFIVYGRRTNGGGGRGGRKPADKTSSYCRQSRVNMEVCPPPHSPFSSTLSPPFSSILLPPPSPFSCLPLPPLLSTFPFSSLIHSPCPFPVPLLPSPSPPPGYLFLPSSPPLPFPASLSPTSLSLPSSPPSTSSLYPGNQIFLPEYTLPSTSRVNQWLEGFPSASRCPGNPGIQVERWREIEDCGPNQCVHCMLVERRGEPGLGELAES
jgi:hypothetical protein